MKSQLTTNQDILSLLLKPLKNQLMFVFGLTILITLLGILYLTFFTPVNYVSKAVFTKTPLLSEIHLNSSGIIVTSQNLIFKSFLERITSKVVQRSALASTGYIEKNSPKFNSSKDLDLHINKLLSSVKLYLLDHKTYDHESIVSYDFPYILSIKGSSIQADILSPFLNKLIELADFQTKESIKNNIKVAINLKIINLVNDRKLLVLKSKNNRIEDIKRMEEEQKILVANISNEILALKSFNQGKLLFTLADLKDSFNISKSLGISENNFSNNYLLDSSKIINIVSPESYQYGEKVLKAKIDILEEKIKRETPYSELLTLKQKLFLAENNPELSMLKSNQNYAPYYIDEIIDIDNEIKQLELIDLNWDNFISMQMHQNSFTRQVKQLSKTIMLVVIIFLGFLLSIVLALVMEKILKNRATN